MTIQDRNRAWFPRYRPAHEVYLEAANAAVRAHYEVLHLGGGADSLRIVPRLAPCSLVASDISLHGLALHLSRRKAVADAARLPFRAASFDMVLCEHVFEHLERPLEVLQECERVLKPGGALLFLAPNRWNYISLLSRLVPVGLRERYKRRLVARGDPQGDAYPTFYRLNTRSAIESIGKQAGMHLERFESMVGWPTYFEINDVMHRFGVLLHWLLERGPSCLHISLFGVLRKPAPNLS